MISALDCLWCISAGTVAENYILPENAPEANLKESKILRGMLLDPRYCVLTVIHADLYTVVPPPTLIKPYFDPLKLFPR